MKTRFGRAAPAMKSSRQKSGRAIGVVHAFELPQDSMGKPRHFCAFCAGPCERGKDQADKIRAVYDAAKALKARM
jgi:hypothetical protein